MSKITLLTTTFYKDTSETRFHLACQMIGNAVGAGHRVVVIDGSPNIAISNAFSDIGAIVHKQISSGMGASRREVFTIGARSDSDYFVWLEPEKIDLIRYVSALVAPLRNGSSDIVVPERTEISWRSYPAPQAESEKSANKIFAEATNNSLDVMFGPVAFARKTMSIFMECNPKEKFGVPDGYIQQIAVMTAVAKKFKVLPLAVDFFYPAVQKFEEETFYKDVMAAKRKLQFEELTHSFRVVSKTMNLKGGKNA